MKIVKFNNGMFALRKWSFLRMRWVYFDSTSTVYPWVSRKDELFLHCLHWSAEEVRKSYHRRKELDKEMKEHRLESRRSRKVTWKGEL